MLSRITGTVFVVPGERNNQPTEELNKINVGLNLKFNKKVTLLFHLIDRSLSHTQPILFTHITMCYRGTL